MNEDQERQGNLIDTTDCLEAVGVFRCWKNFLFIIIILCLLLLQVSFWLVDVGFVSTGEKGKIDAPTAASKEDLSADSAEEAEQIKPAAKEAAIEPNQPQPTEAVVEKPTEAETQNEQAGVGFFEITFARLAQVIRFLDFVLIPASILYCLTMLFSVKVSLLGRLGGINHICRAFFLSLAFVVLLLPWQKFFAGIVVGAMYTPTELLKSCIAAETRDIFTATLHYLRFVGYWLLVVLLLIFSQIRSGRWAKAILHRLEVI